MSSEQERAPAVEPGPSTNALAGEQGQDSNVRGFPEWREAQERYVHPVGETALARFMGSVRAALDLAAIELEAEEVHPADEPRQPVTANGSPNDRAIRR